MEDRDGTKEELLIEPAALRRRVTEIESEKRNLENDVRILRGIERMLNSLIQNSPEPVVVYDAEGRVLFLNSAFATAFGWTNEELQGHRIDYVPDEYAAQTKDTLEKAFKGEPVPSFDTKRLTKDGRVLDVHISSALFRDEEGLPAGHIVTLRDITEIKESERALHESQAKLRTLFDTVKESEEKYRNLFNNSEVGMFRTRLDGSEVLDMNDRFLRIFGRTREEILGNPSAIHWADPGERKELIRRLNTHGRVTDFESRMLNNQGEVRTCLSSLRLYPEQGVVEGSVIDITDRKRAEEALRASEEKYRLLVEKAQEAIFVVQDTIFRFVNPKLEEIVGFSADELIGNSFGRFIHPDDRDTVIEKHYQRLNGAVLPSRYEIRIIDKQNRVKWVEVDSAVVDWEGRPAAMVLMTDVTYRKSAEEAAMQTERLQAIADLSTGVAHHFNNLLQIVMASASLSLADLESGDLTEIKTTLEEMLEAAARGSDMVRRLQTFSSIRADITKEGTTVFDGAAIAGTAAEISKTSWKAEQEKRGTKISLQLDLEEGCLVQGKESEIFEVLVNLIRNAAEALPDGGDIEVKACKEAAEVVITVSDTGIGISEDDLPRVFEPFWSSKGVGIGKGMGLAVTHGLVKRHGGTIAVQSKVGIGTAFTIRLPLSPEPLTKTEQPSIGAAGSRLTILVIEDEEHIATLLERILARAGHGVFKTPSGKEGLAVFHKETVDLVLCDLGMPEMNGWDVGKAIQTICEERRIPKPPFVLLTGWGGQELEREKIAESGTDAVVSKPIDSTALLSTVQEIASRFNVRPHEK